MILQSDATHIPLADDSVDLVIGSPPYLDSRLYLEAGKNIGISRDYRDWLAFMMKATREAVRVSRGLVVWVVAGVTRDWCYQPGPEALLTHWFEAGGRCWRPVYWNRPSVPGSGGEQWYRADVEYCLAFTKCEAKVPWGMPTANGKPAKYAPGGEMSNRKTNGERVNQWGGHKKVTERQKTGETKLQPVKPSHKYGREVLPAIANPGTLLRTNTGGGKLGSSIAHENEAPYSIEVPRFFIRSHCPPGGTVLDPFSGSASTAHAAVMEGRKFIAADLRMSQCELAARRLSSGITPGLFTGAV